MRKHEMLEKAYGLEKYKQLQRDIPALRNLDMLLTVRRRVWTFQLPPRGGPDIWTMVVYRRTEDYHTKKLLEEKWIHKEDTWETVTLELPDGPRDIWTFFFYRVGDPA